MKKISFSFLMLMTTSLIAQQEQPKGLTVTGEGKSYVTPTIAEIRMGIEADAANAPQVQQTLGLLSSQVYRVLQQAEAQRLHTGSMNIYPQYSNDTPPQIIRYRGNVEVSFNVPIEKAGRYIDAAISAGANKMNGFTVKPDDDALARAKHEALTRASQDAIQKSNTVLRALNLTGKKIIRIDIEPDVATPIRPYPMMMATKMAESTEIVSTEQEVPARVLITIALE